MKYLLLSVMIVSLVSTDSSAQPPRVAPGSGGSTNGNGTAPPKKVPDGQSQLTGSAAERDKILRRLEARYGVQSPASSPKSPLTSVTTPISKPLGLLNRIVNEDRFDDLLKLAGAAADPKPLQLVRLALGLLGGLTESGQESAFESAPEEDQKEFAEEFVKYYEAHKKLVEAHKKKVAEIEKERLDTINKAQEKAKNELRKHQLELQLNALNEELKDVKAELDKLK